jgi:hypothetical protein
MRCVLETHFDRVLPSVLPIDFVTDKLLPCATNGRSHNPDRVGAHRSHRHCDRSAGGYSGISIRSRQKLNEKISKLEAAQSPLVRAGSAQPSPVSSLALAMILISLARTVQRTETRPLEETPVLDERGA